MLPETKSISTQHVSTQGLFLTHIRSPRIDAHFERLVRETAGLVEWHFAFDAPPTAAGAPYPQAARCMPDRHARMLQNGGVQGGYMDVAIVPQALALGAPMVWALEYDVDYSGHWSRFFEQFAANDADLLTTTILPLREDRRWRYRHTARAPAGTVDHYRAFHPVMRLSRRLLEAYAARMATPGWRGHYEYILPTFALGTGFSVEDIGGALALCPPDRRGRNYSNTPTDRCLSPGTFVWRPSTDFYFHERPDQFPVADMLHHPVKPSVANWETTRPWRRWRRAWANAVSRLRHP